MFTSLHTKQLLLGILMLAIPCSIFSQITITKDDVLGLIGNVQQTVEVDTASTPKAVDVGLPGGSQSWNFDNIVLGTPLTFSGSFVDVAGTPFASTFTSANIAQRLAGQVVFGQINVPFELYNYFEVTDNGLAAVGIGGVVEILGLKQPILETISDPTPAPLPVSFGQEWAGTDSDTTDDGLTQTKTIETTAFSAIVDAWGTALVGGKNVEALRICNFDTTVSVTFDGNGNQIAGPDTFTVIEYAFPTKNNGFVSQITSLPGETNPNFNVAVAIIRVTEGITTSVDEFPGDGALPTTFDLSQNYPNPFNPETKIRYTIGSAGQVELAIFDLQGRLVRSLINQEMPEGNHAITWDGLDDNGQKAASGRYIYRLSANGEVKSKMMILVK